MAGLFIACFLPPESAAALAVDGGEDPASLHVTLAYLGEQDDTAAEAARQTVGQVAFVSAPLQGVSSGFGVFRNAEQGRDAFWACVDVPGLAELRSEICEALCEAGLDPAATHGYSPHVTLAYLDAGRPVLVGPSEPVPLLLGSVSVCQPGTEPARLPLLGVYLAKEQPSASEVHVDAPLGSQRKPRKRKRGDADALDEMSVSVLKADDEQQVVTGIVLQPDVPDSQGDVVTADEIEKAAHRFLYQGTPIGIQHAALAPESVRPVESYLAPVDFVAETPRGREMVRKGSWIVAAHVPDPEFWSLVKSDTMTGWSIAGTGRRTPIQA